MREVIVQKTIFPRLRRLGGQRSLAQPSLPRAKGHVGSRPSHQPNTQKGAEGHSIATCSPSYGSGRRIEASKRIWK